MKDYYTLKEVILGLRNEQLRIASKINKLKQKLNIINNRKYSESDFYFNSVNDSAELVFLLHEKYSLLENVLNILSLDFVNFNEGKIYCERIRELENGNYKIGGLAGIITNVPSEQQESFNKIVDELLNDPFVLNVLVYVRKHRKYDDYLRLDPLGTKYIGSWRDRINNLSYFAANDTLSVLNTYKKKTYKESLDELFDLKFCVSDFSDYLQDVIDNNDETKKDIIIPDGKFYKKSANFYLNNEREAFVLVKK